MMIAHGQMGTIFGMRFVQTESVGNRHTRRKAMKKPSKPKPSKPRPRPTY